MKFVVTKELGRLGKWLRILGFDVLYYQKENLMSLLVEAIRDNRVIITRCKKFKNLSGKQVVVLEENEIKKQLQEVIDKLNMHIDKDKMFIRCIICNELLKDVDKEKIKDKVPIYVYKTQREFKMCEKCKRVYWQGTHWGNIENTLEEISG